MSTDSWPQDLLSPELILDIPFDMTRATRKQTLAPITRKVAKSSRPALLKMGKTPETRKLPSCSLQTKSANAGQTLP